MNNDQPPRIDPDKLDFSQFHPLDHWPYTARCRGLYGGGRHHLHLSWVFRRKPALRAATTCKLGFHGPWVKWWRGGPGPQGATYIGRRCAYCGAKQKEISRE